MVHVPFLFTVDRIFDIVSAQMQNEVRKMSIHSVREKWSLTILKLAFMF